MQIIYLPKFAREYRKLPEVIQGAAERKERIFKQDPFAPILKTHQLKGEIKIFWSFSVNYKYRIIFEFGKNRQKAYFHSIGDHSIYK